MHQLQQCGTKWTDGLIIIIIIIIIIINEYD